MSRVPLAWSSCLCASLAVVVLSSQGSPSFVITGARIADGTGAPLRAGSVRVEGDTIAVVGVVTPRTGETVVEPVFTFEVGVETWFAVPAFLDVVRWAQERFLQTQIRFKVAGLAELWPPISP